MTFLKALEILKKHNNIKYTRVLWEDPAADYRDFLNEGFEKYYQRLAIFGVDKSIKDNIIKLMINDGFWNILNQDADLLYAFSLLGICTTLGKTVSESASMLTAIGLNANDCLKGLRSATAQHRIPILHRIDQDEYCYY